MAWTMDLDFKMIEYKDIVVCARTIDKNKPNTVRLSPYQAWLFRSKLKLMVNAGEKCSVPANIFDTLKFLFIVAAILLTCPKVAFLGDYFDFDADAFQRIEFEKASGGVFIQFRPRKKINTINGVTH